jgi:hypothetical protein
MPMSNSRIASRHCWYRVNPDANVKGITMKRYELCLIAAGIVGMGVIAFAMTPSGRLFAKEHTHQTQPGAAVAATRTPQVEVCYDSQLREVSCNDQLIESAVTGYPAP